MNPYAYPKFRHVRSEQPAEYKAYPRYKPFLRREFKEKCVYCRRPDGGLHQDYGVDHYRPQSRFPDLVAAYTNLFYACNSCNRRKGKYWPSAAQLKANQFIPNPCDHVMIQHLKYQGAKVEAKSVAGDFTLRLLDLNNPDLMRYREGMLVMVEAAEATRKKAQQVLQDLTELRALGKANGAAIDSAIAQAQTKVQKVDSALRTLSGE